MTRLELGDYALDLQLELTGDYALPVPGGALQRLRDDLKTARYPNNSDVICTDEEEEYHWGDEADWSHHVKEKYDHPPAEASDWADERANFADFLATLSKVSAKIGKVCCHKEYLG